MLSYGVSWSTSSVTYSNPLPLKLLAQQLLIARDTGRQYAFNLTVLIASIFGLALAGPSTYEGVLVLTAFVGFGVGGNIPIDTTICLEFLPQEKRFLLAVLSVFQPIGVVLSCAITYGLLPRYSCGNGADGEKLPSCNNVAAGQPCCTKASNRGWRYTLIVLGGITLVIFFLRFVVFRFQESPKFLLYRGRDEKAVRVLHHVAKFNKKDTTISLETFDALTSEDNSTISNDTPSSMLGGGKLMDKASWSEKVKIELSRYKILFRTPAMARLTILVWITYIFDYWGFSIAGKPLTLILYHCCMLISEKAPSSPKSSSRRTPKSTSQPKKPTATSSSSTSPASSASSSAHSCTRSPASGASGL